MPEPNEKDDGLARPQPQASTAKAPAASRLSAQTFRIPGVAETHQRLVSALILMPIGLGVVWAGGWWLTAAVTIAAALMTYEWIRLVAPGRWGRLAFLYGVALLIALLNGQAGDVRSGALTLLVGAGAATGWAVLSGRTDKQLMAGLGLLYVGFPSLIFVSWETGLNQASLSLLGLMCAVWAADTAAYIIGSRFGRHRLAPHISPTKTWEGLGAGMLASGVFCAVWCTLLDGMSPLFGLAIGFLVGLVAELGDMLESAIKRRFGVKDMSGLIPGHGGVMDRLDSLLLVTTLAGAGAALWMV